jgi:hypothetical protein
MRIPTAALAGAAVLLVAAAPAMAQAQQQQASAAAVDLSGRWELSIDLAEGTAQGTLTLAQDGGAVRGTLETQDGRAELQSGTIKENAVAFRASITHGGQPVELAFTGTVEGNTMSGTARGAAGTVSWTATKAEGR